jgi:acyl-homoserine-lactone acylase
MQEFMKALEWHAFAGLNIVYADKDNNIMMYDNNQFPKRNPKYNWKKVLPGNTLATLWKSNDYYCIDSLQKTINPNEGFVFNCNNTVFNTTGYLDKWNFLRHPLKKFYFPYENNRSLRFSYLFNDLKGKKITWEDFLRIKYDQTFQKPYYMSVFSNMGELINISPDKYPEVRDIFLKIKNWNGNADVNNTSATIIALLMAKMTMPLIEEGRIPFYEVKVKEKYFFKILAEVKKEMLKHFGSIDVPLGEVQKLVRGNKVLPMSGITDVIAAMSSVPYKNGMLRADVGETYIELVRFTDSLPIIESVSPYGSSNVPGSKHYDDQMELFVSKKRKSMSMDYKVIIKNAEKIYHPG